MLLLQVLGAGLSKIDFISILEGLGTVGALGLFLYYLKETVRRKDKEIKELIKENNALQERIIKVMEEKAVQASSAIVTMQEMYRELKNLKNRIDK